MKTPSEANFLFKRVLAQIPCQIIDTFTEEQLAALELACQQIKNKKHAINIQLSMPLYKGGFYLTVLAGRERRSVQRLRTEGVICSQGAIVGVVLAVVLVGAATTIGLAQFFRSHMNELQKSEYHPTAIPWLESESECQQTGRYWQEGNCWDREHDANF